jgi:hypothetical protein
LAYRKGKVHQGSNLIPVPRLNLAFSP